MPDNNPDLSYDFNAAASGPPDPPSSLASADAPEPSTEPTPPAPEMAAAEPEVSDGFNDAAVGKPGGPSNAVAKSDIDKLEQSKPVLETYNYNCDFTPGGSLERSSHEQIETAKGIRIAEINHEQDHIRARLNRMKDRARDDFERT